MPAMFHYSGNRPKPVLPGGRPGKKSRVARGFRPKRTVK